MTPKESYIGKPVRSVQTMLRSIAAANHESCGIIPDGIFGNETMNAVNQFQRSHDLPATGVVDEQTWIHITDAYQQALTELTPACPLEVEMKPCSKLRPGCCRQEVYLIQSMLHTISSAYSCICDPGFSGTLDAAACDSLSSFQQMCGLPMTGEVDKATWKYLALHYPLAVGRLSSDTAQNL